MITLSSEEIEFFKEQGYLIKRGVLDPTLMAKARASMWEAAPSVGLDPNDPDTWIGPVEESSDDRDSALWGYSWKYRKHGGEDWMVRLLAKDPSVWAMAEQLLGEGNLAEPTRIRGIYCMLPEGDKPATPYRCHVDRHPFHLGVVGYIDDVDLDAHALGKWNEKIGQWRVVTRIVRHVRTVLEASTRQDDG